MIVWKLFLAPFAFIYGSITLVRNKLFDFGIFQSYTIPIKSIVVGNLSVGGTGKTPHVFYIANLLSNKYNVSILSRGYGRKSTGYKQVFHHSKAIEVGDEPLLLKNRLNEDVSIAVCENRKDGIINLIKQVDPKVVVLDDAFQHRKVKAEINILLTEYNRPFFNDYSLPMGRLREFRFGKNRADIFVVTKCPLNLTDKQKKEFTKKIGVDGKSVFFSKIVYAPFKPFSNNQISSFSTILLVTAIADDSKIVEHLSGHFSVKTLKFRDHHTFTKEDITKIHLKFDLLPLNNSIILTTEKDFVKLKEFKEITEGKYPWSFLPIDIEIDREKEFNQLLLNYVGTI